jgi:hypothetical protein
MYPQYANQMYANMYQGQMYQPYTPYNPYAAAGQPGFPPQVRRCEADCVTYWGISQLIDVLKREMVAGQGGAEGAAFTLSVWGGSWG